MEKEIDYLEIEKYLLGELKGDSLLSFEKRLKNNKEFAQEVALYKEVNTSLSARFSNYEEENKLRNTLEDLGTIHFNKSFISDKKEENKIVKVFSLKKYSKYLVAASLILFASLIWMNSDSTASYSDYNDFEMLDLVIRGDNNKNLIEVQKAFNNKDFTKAQTIFEKILKEDSTKVELQLYLAICMIEQDNFKPAEQILNTIIQGNSIYKNDAIWHLALSKLKQKKYNDCKELLKTLPKEFDNYNKAKKIIDSI